MTLFARAHYIIHRLLLESSSNELLSTIQVDIESRKGSLEAISANLENILYPWLKPTFSSILQMQQSLIKNSTGIVIPCGDRHFYVTTHLILSLRRIFKINLPVEVYYAGDRDLSQAKINSLSRLLNVRVINLHNSFPLETRRGESWSYKPFTLLASNFSKILFMDSDIAFFRPPLEILESQRFQKNKLLFYRDRKLWVDNGGGGTNGAFLLHEMNPHMSNYAYSGAYAQSVFDGIRGTTDEMESGFFAVDKSDTGVFFSLLFAAKLNSKEEREQFYKASYGDKESFWFATEALRVPYAFNPSYGGSIGIKGASSGENGYTQVCEGHLLHSNEQNQPFWMHGGSVLGSWYMTVTPENLDFAEFNWMAFHYKWELQDQIWKDGMNCIEQKTSRTAEIADEEMALIEEYRDLFRELKVVQ
ncbi:hypothetical protein HK100_005312 [Physocladia obscura]|uniref:Nucleotide-diphospho-sugar transferase n=1 Tax=Physocladia obscura TaxID=109957 RepID=A0AAD5SXG9_9FUNG|nr:hypothetical protein HK100_005312 [Physocladia obscura]